MLLRPLPKRAALALLLTAMSSNIVLAQRGDEAGSSGEANRYRAETAVVLINATVLDHKGHPVRGLHREDFKVLDEKKPREVTYFDEEATPVSAVIVFDASKSMENKLVMSRRAVAKLVDAPNDGDEYSLIAVTTQPKLVSDWTTSASRVQSSLLTITAEGRTALLDALELALQQLKTARNPRKAIVLVSDGGDNASRHTRNEVTRGLQESDASLYSVDITRPIQGSPLSQEEIWCQDLLTKLSERSGGRYFPVEQPDDLEKAINQVHDELRWQYVLGYHAPDARSDGRFRRVRVEMSTPRNPRVSVFSRPGYRSTP